VREEIASWTERCEEHKQVRNRPSSLPPPPPLLTLRSRRPAGWRWRSSPCAPTAWRRLRRRARTRSAPASCSRSTSRRRT
jgi:hypothetical protein